MRTHAPDYLAWIRTLPCIICGDDTSTEACHIKMGDPRLAKPPASNHIRTHDYWVLPMCGRHHREQHRGIERQFWKQHAIDCTRTALRLWVAKDDYQTALLVLKAAKEFP